MRQTVVAVLSVLSMLVSLGPTGASAQVVPVTPAPWLPRTWVYGAAPDGRLFCYRHDSAYIGTANWSYGVQVGTGWQVRQVFSGGGKTYAVLTDGRLMWFDHTGYENCTGAWVGGRVVGTGWNIFSALIATGEGVIYGLMPGGSVRWYRHLGYQDGSFNWAPDSGTEVLGLGTDNGDFFTTGDQRFYFHARGSTLLSSFKKQNPYTAATPSGVLGIKACTNRAMLTGQPCGFEGHGTVTDPQFAPYARMFAAQDGIIYGVKANGDLFWHRHLTWQSGLPLAGSGFRDGFYPAPLSPSFWSGPTLVGSAWNQMAHVFARVP